MPLAADHTLFAALPPLPPRAPDSHKGTLGTVLVIGGCTDGKVVMIGAPALTALAALRAGCGLVKLACPASILPIAIASAPSATGIPLPQRPDGRLDPSAAAVAIDAVLPKVAAIAIGPGFGVGYEQQQTLARLIAPADDRPMVIDADGLNNLAALRDFSLDLKAPAVLTPHPGEFARLAESLTLKAAPFAADDSAGRSAAALVMARRLGCVIVLKGAATIVASPSPDDETWVCPVQNEPALATAGTGDVLTGIIASFLAQFWKPHLGPIAPADRGGLSLFDAARWGVLIHALAASRWSALHGHAGMLARDLADLVPDILKDAPRAAGKPAKT